jgi:hypothetical protein
MAGLKILITNTTLAERSGSVLYVHDLAMQLLARGHTPIVYSRHHGAMVEEFRNATIPVIDDLDNLGAAPDVIHGHHHLETMTALLHFPGTPAVYVCHDWWHDRDRPPRFPRIRRYLAVDRPCLDRMIYEEGIPASQARIRLGFVDLARFQPRPPLPERPGRALLFSNYGEEGPYLDAVRGACRAAGLGLDVLGLRFGNADPRPERLLGQYDIVLAKARAAMEAACVGCAVVIHHVRHVGPLVTAAEVERLLPLNFGIRAMTPPLSPAEVAVRLESELRRYDRDDAAEVSRRVRATVGAEEAVDELLALYREVIAEQAADRETGRDAELRAAARYLTRLADASRPVEAPLIADPPPGAPTAQPATEPAAQLATTASSDEPEPALSAPDLRQRTLALPRLGRLARLIGDRKR